MICQCAWLLVLTKVGIKRPAGRACSASGWVVIPSHTPACAAITPKSMPPQATRVRLEQDGMAHHHQAQVAHGAAHDLQDIRGGQQPSTRLMAMPARNNFNATRRAAPTIRT